MKTNTPTQTKTNTVQPEVVTQACRHIEEQLGCSRERAFDLLYGAAEARRSGLYSMAATILHAPDVRPYVSNYQTVRG